MEIVCGLLGGHEVVPRVGEEEPWVFSMIFRFSNWAGLNLHCDKSSPKYYDVFLYGFLVGDGSGSA